MNYVAITPQIASPVRYVLFDSAVIAASEANNAGDVLLRRVGRESGFDDAVFLAVDAEVP